MPCVSQIKNKQKCGYDSANRRVSAGGSLLTPKLNSPAVNATYDAANRISTANGQTYVYDKAGMMLSDGLQSYAWNAKGQLTQIKNQSGQITALFSYDAQGRRDSKTVITSAIANTTTVNTLTSRYTYDGENILQERMTTGVGASAAVTSSLTSTANPVINSYLHGAGVDEHIGLQTNGSAASSSPASTYSSYHFITDALGSTVQLATPAGAAVVSYSYDAYGNTDINPTPNTPIPSNPFQYTGRENDAINTANAGTTVTPLGLYYYRARYYAPTVGRFISEDPIGLEAGVNTHAYVLGDPVQKRDPFGLFDITDASSVPAGDYQGHSGIVNGISGGMQLLALAPLVGAGAGGGVMVCAIPSNTLGRAALLAGSMFMKSGFAPNKAPSIPTPSLPSISQAFKNMSNIKKASQGPRQNNGAPPLP